MNDDRSDSLVPPRSVASAGALGVSHGVRPAPTLLCFGVNHRTADAATRESLQRNWRRLEDELRTLRACAWSRWRLLEWASLETCNRFELYAAVEGQRWAFGAWLRSRLEALGASAPAAPIASDPLGRSLYRLVDGDAVRHLFAVAAGVDSMVRGEEEILGQVRRAAAGARENGALGEHLDTLFRAAVRAGRRVRRETGIGRRRGSVATLAVDRAEERLRGAASPPVAPEAAGSAGASAAGLARSRVLVLGLGDVGRATLAHLLRHHRGGAIGVINRSGEAAERAAARHGARWWPLDELDQALAWADVVFACAAVAEPLIGPQRIAALTRQRGARPLLLVDLGMPRNVDPACAELEAVEVLALDQLGDGGRVEDDTSERSRVDRILAGELETYLREGRGVTVEPAVRELRRWSEELRRDELARLRRSLGAVDEDTWRALEDFSRSLTDKLLHDPTTRLRESVEEGTSEEHLRALRRLFGLERRRRDSASA